jgi:hypothetical protein
MARGVRPNTCPSASQANQVAASYVTNARAFSGPGSNDLWPPLVDAQAAGPTRIGDSERRVVHVPRGHVGDPPSQRRQPRRQGTRSQKGE